MRTKINPTKKVTVVKDKLVAVKMTASQAKMWHFDRERLERQEAQKGLKIVCDTINFLTTNLLSCNSEGRILGIRNKLDQVDVHLNTALQHQLEYAKFSAMVDGEIDEEI